MNLFKLIKKRYRIHNRCEARIFCMHHYNSLPLPTPKLRMKFCSKCGKVGIVEVPRYKKEEK